MNLNALRFFYEASKYASLTEASHYLHISQPALTKHIKNLEKEYQVALVKKVGRQIEVTDLGEKILKEATILFEQEKKIESLLTNQTNQSLVIGTTQLNSDYLMKRLLLHKEKESYQLKFMTDNTQSLFKMLQSRRINYAILPDNNTFLELDKAFVFSDELVFVAHPDYCSDKLTQLELANFQFIKRETGSFLQKTLEQTETISPSFSVEVSGHSSALVACQLQQGIYLSSYTSVEQLIQEGSLKEITIEDITFDKRHFYLYWNKDNLTQVHSTFTTGLIKQLKKEANHE